MTNNNGFPSGASLKNLSDLSPRVRTHLFRDPFYSFLLSVTCLLSLVFLRPSQDNFRLRFIILFVSFIFKVSLFIFLQIFAFANGVCSAPLIASTLAFYPGFLLFLFYLFIGFTRVLTLGFTSTALSFLSFSLGALLTERRSFIFLGGMLGTALTSLSLLNLFNGLLRNSGVDTLILFSGLLMFSGYVIYDTQVIVERASQGATDVVADSLRLFGDLVGIFYRILIILRRQRDQEDRKRDRRRL